MFSVEIHFNQNTESIAEIIDKIDDCFTYYKLPCISKTDDKIIYGDNGNPRDIGKLYGAIGKVSDIPYALNVISDGYIVRGDIKETLMTNFFKR